MKNYNANKYFYSTIGTVFDAYPSFLWPNGEFGKKVIILGVDNSHCHIPMMMMMMIVIIIIIKVTMTIITKFLSKIH